MTWDNRHKIALGLIAASFAFNSAILFNSPSLGDLSILFSCAFASLLTLSWVITLLKTNFGRIAFTISILVCLLTAIYVLNDNTNQYEHLREISLIGNIMSSMAIIILGTINYRKINTHNMH